MQPVPQCIEVSPQNPYVEQQEPKVDPVQVCGPPHSPLVEALREPAGTVVFDPAEGLGTEEGAADAVADGAAATGVDAKTPPGKLAVGDAAEAEVARVVAGVARADEAEVDEVAIPADAAGDALPLAAGAAPAAPQSPVRPVVDDTVPVTSGPGSGKEISMPSTVVHAGDPMLATKSFGREAKATAGAVPVPAPTVILAQFMYISRLPILLNQVQPKTAAPSVASEGIVKSNF